MIMIIDTSCIVCAEIKCAQQCKDNEEKSEDNLKRLMKILIFDSKYDDIEHNIHWNQLYEKLND